MESIKAERRPYFVEGDSERRNGARIEGEYTSVEDNLELVASFVKAVDSKDWRYVRDCFDKNAVLTFHGSQGARVSIEDAIEGWKAEAVTFPDARREMLRGFGQDDVVCIEIQETGTQKGTLEHAGKTYQPSGRRFKIMVCAILRVQDHRITEASVYHNPQEYLSQLGIL